MRGREKGGSKYLDERWRRSHSTPLAVVFVAQEKVPSRRDRLRIPFHMNFNSVCASNGERGQRLLDKHCRDLTAGISEVTHANDIDDICSEDKNVLVKNDQTHHDPSRDAWGRGKTRSGCRTNARTGVGLGRNDRRMLALEEDRETNIASFPSPHPNRGKGPTHSTEPGQQASRPDRYIDEVYR